MARLGPFIKWLLVLRPKSLFILTGLFGRLALPIKILAKPSFDGENKAIGLVPRPLLTQSKLSLT
jgi:hypothetical protein